MIAAMEAIVSDLSIPNDPNKCEHVRLDAVWPILASLIQYHVRRSLREHIHRNLRMYIRHLRLEAHHGALVDHSRN